MSKIRTITGAVLNDDDKLRQKIMNITAEYCGGVFHFKKMIFYTLNELYQNNFLDMSDRQNESPSMQEYFDLFSKYPDEPISFDGYIVSPDRDDYRVTIDTIKGASNNMGFIRDLFQLCKDYDGIKRIRKGVQYVWYD